ncbi:MAG: cation transporter [Oscillospiraceae bacterium]|jgi:copper chaperone|nr:cation transporter [Oscillospiraceae bacterium]
MNTITLKVEGMMCEHCEKAVTGAVKALDAGAAVDVDLAAGTVTVGTDTLTRGQIAAAIDEQGYDVLD